MSSQQPPRPRGNRKTLVIGFDFGTHSTKVVVRERGKKDGRIAAFDAFAKGYPRFASPSLVRQIGDKLLFGSKALTTSQGTLLSYLKVSLISPRERNGSQMLTTETLVAAYFAWAFQQVRAVLADDGFSNVFINVAAPMGHVEDPLLKAKYLQIVQAAWQLVFDLGSRSIRQEVSIAEVTDRLDPLLTSPVLGSEHRRFDVLPETIAPVVSLSLEPYMEPRVYAVIDMGAGTTELSVFHAGSSGADQKVLCYKDTTILLGGKDLESPAHGKQGDAVIAQIAREYRDIWERAYSVDAANPLSKRRWKDLTLVLSGGGTRHPAVEDRLRITNPVPRWRDFKTSYKVLRHAPGTLELPAGMSKGDGCMFAVANGLAIERKKWPVVFEPHEIEPLTAPKPHKPKREWWQTEPRPRWV